MKICNECGYENHDVAKICNKCNARLDRDDMSEVQITKSAVGLVKNKTASLLEGIGIFILVVGTIGGLIIASNTGGYGGFSFLAFVYIFTISLISFALFKGFAEIINLLQGLNDRKDA